MTLMETMQTMDSGLTEREKDIRRYLLDHPEKVELFSARELGAATFTSAASVTHFCQKIGCKGYPDFKLRFLAELRQASSQAHAIEGEVLMTPRENAVSLLRKITEVQHRSVEQTRAELDLNQLIRVYQRLLDAQHLDFYAYDRSACIAEYACNQFYFAGKRAQIYRDTNMQGLNASIPATGHVAILLSHTGRNARLVALAKLLHLDASQQPEVKQGLLNRVIATMSAVFAPFCLHSGGRRPGAGLPDHRHHFCAGFRRYRHLRGAQLYFLDAVHLFAGADRHYSVQALQLQHLYCRVVLLGPRQPRLDLDGRPHRRRGEHPIYHFQYGGDDLHFHRPAPAVPGAGAQLSGALPQ